VVLRQELIDCMADHIIRQLKFGGLTMSVSLIRNTVRALGFVPDEYDGFMARVAWGLEEKPSVVVGKVERDSQGLPIRVWYNEELEEMANGVI
jgi:hypothetical protein